MNPFIHYMYTGDAKYVYEGWVGPCLPEGVDFGDLSPYRKVELYAKSRITAGMLLQLAAAWGVKDAHMYDDLLKFCKEFSEWEREEYEVCASIILGCSQRYISYRIYWSTTRGGGKRF